MLRLRYSENIMCFMYWKGGYDIFSEDLIASHLGGNYERAKVF